MSSISRRSVILSAAAAACVGGSILAQEAKRAPAADAVMADAMKKAKDTKRAIFTHFGASW